MEQEPEPAETTRDRLILRAGISLVLRRSGGLREQRSRPVRAATLRRILEDPGGARHSNEQSAFRACRHKKYACLAMLACGRAVAQLDVSPHRRVDSEC